jgi:ABC-type taurine transport system ATPase subunit
MAKLVLENITYTYPEKGSGPQRRGDLAQINLHLDEATATAVVGAAGAGTNTLLNLIAGLIQPTEGRVLWKRQPVTGQSADRGVVFHQSALYPWLSVAENIEFGLKARKMPRRERKMRVAEYLDRFYLTKKATQPVYQVEDHHDLILISFARCLASEPELVLIGDEPLSQINDRFRMRLQKALLKFWSDKQTMLLLVTSDVEEALLMASKIYIMSGRPGRIVKQYESGFYDRVQHEGVEAVRHLPEFRQMRRDVLRHVI